jgi:23S rRNA (guanosine2251-2'-O)-methyltransferase
VDEPKSRGQRSPRRGGSGGSGGGSKGRPRGRNTGQQRRPPQKGKQQQRGGKPQQGSPRSVPLGQLPDNFIYGAHPVAVALDQQQLKTLYFDQGRQNERLQHLHAQSAEQGVQIRPLQRQGWSKILPADQHQGIAGLVYDPPTVYIEDVVAEAGGSSAILVLDQVQDPQNLGAILRTAAAAGVDAVVLPKAGGCPITAAVHRASAGMSLVVRIVEDQNLARTIDYLKDKGYWVVGCDSGEGEDACLFEFPRKRVIVMGNEAEGMRRLTRESCDYLVKIPMAAGVESLNVSVATAVVLFLAKADLARAEFEAAQAGDNGSGADGNTAPVDAAPAVGGGEAAPAADVPEEG